MPEVNIPANLILKIADLNLRISNCSPNYVKFLPHLEEFFSHSKDQLIDLDIRIEFAKRNDLPSFSIASQIFTTKSTWSLYQCSDNHLLWLDVPCLSEPPDRLVFINSDFTEVKIYIVFDLESKACSLDPLSYPLDQILMIHLLGRGGGLLVHACAISYEQSGFLFLGSSGSGKTTLVDLFANNSEALILNDDRIIIRQINQQLQIYGTPWHGTGCFANNYTAPLKAIYFLKQSSQNEIVAMDSLAAVSRLFVTCFSALWDKRATEFTLDFCKDICSKIPCYELGFLPDQSVVEYFKESL